MDISDINILASLVRSRKKGNQTFSGLDLVLLIDVFQAFSFFCEICTNNRFIVKKRTLENQQDSLSELVVCQRKLVSAALLGLKMWNSRMFIEDALNGN
jgi:hypothetical protein